MDSMVYVDIAVVLGVLNYYYYFYLVLLSPSHRTNYWHLPLILQNICPALYFKVINIAFFGTWRIFLPAV